MKKSDQLLVNTYASFLVDPNTLLIQEYNDHAGRYLQHNIDHHNMHISDIINWDSSIDKQIQFKQNKKILYTSKLVHEALDIIVNVQVLTINNNAYYNVTLIDNLEDLEILSTKNIDSEIAGNGLFSNIFQYSPIGLVLVDSNTMLYKANKYMFDSFELKAREVIGERFGNVFGCSSVAESRFLCGEAEECKDCKLRNGVQRVLSEQITIEGFEIGHDFQINGRTVTKWFTLSASPVTYGNQVFALVSFVDITQRVRMEDRLRELGITDPLTDLYNRGHIMKLLHESLHTKKYDYISVALIDIDNFKTVNDVYGHLTGDKILILLANILKEQLRYSDYTGRYGGEEFLIIFNETQANAAVDVIKRIQDIFRIKSSKIIEKAVTFSVGLNEVHIRDSIDDHEINLILNKSDKLMYQAKALGKDRVCVDKHFEE